MLQKTIQTHMFAKGKAVVSGATVSLIVRPAKANHGIVFTRTDLPGKPKVYVNPHQANIRQNHIDLIGQDTSVYGVEPILAALYGLGIDNVEIDIHGAEVPLMLNGAASWVFLLQAAGIHTLAQKRDIIRVNEPMMVRAGKEWVRLFPYQGLRVSIHDQKQKKPISLLSANRVVDFSPAVFVSDLCYTDMSLAYEAHARGASNALNSLAKHNITRHQSHLQVNSTIVRFLAMCCLTGADIQTLYVKFGSTMESDFLAVKELYETYHSMDLPVGGVSGKKVASIA